MQTDVYDDDEPLLSFFLKDAKKDGGKRMMCFYSHSFKKTKNDWLALFGAATAILC